MYGYHVPNVMAEWFELSHSRFAGVYVDLHNIARWIVVQTVDGATQRAHGTFSSETGACIVDAGNVPPHDLARIADAHSPRLTKRR